MSSNIDGIIVKAYGGFYFVKAGASLWRCTLRGVFRHRNIAPLVGDRVLLSVDAQDQAVVEEVYPRRNALLRPPVANVDRSVIVFAVRDPEPTLALLDRFLIQSGAEEVLPVICFNKIDLEEGRTPEFAPAYRAAGYTVLLTSARAGAGIEELRQILAEGISVFAGPSGSGKSSLLNAVQSGLSLKTGEVGHKLKRGRHTTRHVELLTMEGGGLVADTPGFSTLFLPEMKRVELVYFFPEMEKYNNSCRFRGCLHKAEPDCAVKRAVAGKEIDGGRYGRYIDMLNEIIVRERSY
ncbi:MAG: GTPase RsgA [Peptococcaceae bacterium BRH_c4a]|nr:MAG: GTPase RsgA [Peptococcaceae bacterium BRH_c4a]